MLWLIAGYAAYVVAVVALMNLGFKWLTREKTK